MGSHRRHHGGGFLARCVSRRSTAPGDRRQLVRRNRADVAGEDDTYWRCKDSNWDIIVRWDGFDAQETGCELNTIKRQGAAWLASFSCSGAGLTWLEDDEIRVGKDGWTLEAKIKNVRRVGDPIRYCVANKC